MTGIRAKQKRATRDKVLAAARTLFLGRPFDEVGVREIAAQAGVATGTVIAAFGSKGDLLNAIVIEDFEQMFARMTDLAFEDDSTVGRLCAYAQIAVGHHSRQLPVVQASMADGWTRSPASEQRVRRVTGPILDLLQATLRRGIERGEIAPGADLRLGAELIMEAVLNAYRKAVFDTVAPDRLMDVVAPRIALLVSGLSVAPVAQAAKAA